MAHALELVTGRKPHMVWHAKTELPDVDLVVVPGGFSYGDYLRCGAIAARSPVMAAVRQHVDSGRHVLGVCNGFQILTEAGLLPGVLMRNASLKFLCREVRLRVETADSAFTGAYEAGAVIRVPVAHGEGNYFADAETLARLEGEGRILFRYCDAAGAVTPEADPNGSVNHIAGIANDRGTVLGMMPHPENHVDPAQGCTDGRGLFESLARAIG
jgi:phosphoribosylformylglycinamidine synthase